MIHFAIFAKYWEPGKVKTRLAKKLGPDAACDVYYRFLSHLVKKFAAVGERRTVVYSPRPAEQLFRDEIATAWDLAPQAEGDLGNRMREFFEVNAGAGVKNVLVGSDTPNLPVRYVEMAGEMLDDSDVVLGPSADGGYYLIAMKAPVAALFEDVEWSTEDVLSTTIEKMNSLGIRYQLLPELKDVDEFPDLQLLIAGLQSAGDEEDSALLQELSRLELPL